MYKKDVVKRMIANEENAFEVMRNDCYKPIFRTAMKSLHDEELSRAVVFKTYDDIKKDIANLEDDEHFEEFSYKITQSNIKLAQKGKDEFLNEFDKNNAKALDKMEELENQKIKDAPALNEEQEENLDLDTDNYNKIIETTLSDKTNEEEWKPILFEPEDGQDEFNINVSVWPAEPTFSNSASEEDKKDSKQNESESKSSQTRIRGPQKIERKRAFWGNMFMLIAILLLIVTIYMLAKENWF